MSRLGINSALALLFMGCATPDTDGQVDLETLATEDFSDDPVQLLSLTELMDALYSGEEVTATLRYGECELDGRPGPDAIGGIKIETYEWFAEGLIGNETDYVAFSKSSLVLISGQHVYDYVKVRVYDDGYVQVIAEYLDVETFDVEMYEEFDCELDQGDGGSVSLWAR